MQQEAMMSDHGSYSVWEMDNSHGGAPLQSGHGLLERRGRTALQPIQVSAPAVGPYTGSEDSIDDSVDGMGVRRRSSTDPSAFHSSDSFRMFNNQASDVDGAESRLRKVRIGDHSTATVRENMYDMVSEEEERAKRGCFRQLGLDPQNFYDAGAGIGPPSFGSSGFGSSGEFNFAPAGFGDLNGALQANMFAHQAHFMPHNHAQMIQVNTW